VEQDTWRLQTDRLSRKAQGKEDWEAWHFPLLLLFLRHYNFILWKFRPQCLSILDALCPVFSFQQLQTLRDIIFESVLWAAFQMVSNCRFLLLAFRCSVCIHVQTISVFVIW
jgi:hypothetical protein